MLVPEEVGLATNQQTEVVPRSYNSRPQDLFLEGESFFIFLNERRELR
jgi:hypothetical protein